MRDISNGPESMLEIELVQLFQKSGWDCLFNAQPIKMPEGSLFHPDITLAKEGHVYGFVECIAPNRNFLKKTKGIVFAVKELKPEIFILSDGVNFEVYFDGKLYGQMTIPIEFDIYLQMKKEREHGQNDQEARNDDDSN